VGIILKKWSLNGGGLLIETEMYALLGQNQVVFE
jgi:hypothetical protein